MERKTSLPPGQTRHRSPHKADAWSAAKEAALHHIIIDRWSAHATARSAEVSVSRATLYRWMNSEEWRLRAEALHGEIRRTLADVAIAQQHERMVRRNRDWTRLQEMIGDRAAYYQTMETTPYPGVETGLLVRMPGKDGDRWQLDKATLDALLALEKETAIELGDMPGAGGGAAASTGGGMAIYLEGSDLLPAYALGDAVDVFEAGLNLLAAGLLPETTEECERMAFRAARIICGFRDDEPWEWDEEVLKAVRGADWFLLERSEPAGSA